MSDLWGFASGAQQAQQDSQSKQLFQLQMAEGGMKLQEESMALAAAKMTMDQQAKALALLGQKQAARKSATSPAAQQTPSDNLSDYFTDAASSYAEAGSPVLASEMADKAVSIKKGEGELLKQANEQRAKDLEWAHQNISSVQDQASWESYQMAYSAELGHSVDPKIAQMSYDQLKSSGMLTTIQSGLGVQLEQAKVAKAKADAKIADAELLDKELQPALTRSKTAAENALAAARGKVGAKPPSGYEWDPDDPTQMKPIPGGPADPAVIAAKAGAKADAAAKRAADKQAPVKDRANELIDQMISAAQKSKGKVLGVTGAGGMVKRGVETAENVAGVSGDTSAHDFESGMSELQLLLPKLMTGTSKSAADERAKVAKIARGLQLGDTPQNTVSALRKLKESLNNETEAKPKDNFNKGQVYTDANGNKATYMGDGQWQPL